MDRRVVWTEEALADLEAVAEFIGRNSPSYAGVFVKRIREAARTLSRMSERGRSVPEVDEPSIREIFVNRYRLIYEVTPEDLYVLALIHGARDLEALWKRRTGRPVDPEGD